jgi:CBS domain-containing membrane protein
MFVRDYMTRNVTTLPDDAKLLDAALMIRRTGKRHVPIVAKDSGKVVGIISDRDILRLTPSVLSDAMSEEEYNRVFEETPITKAMTRDPFSVSPDAPIAEAVGMLYSKKIGAVLAVQDDELIGIVTITDMLSLLSELLANANGASA